MTRAQVIERMQQAQARVLREVWARRNSDLPLKSPQEMLTLASIVEKETGKADERSRVAGVFINRLNRNMKLQSDPTIVYGLVGGKGTLGRGILRSEIDQATPYNTYAIAGLPPGPIANPGTRRAGGGGEPVAHARALFRRRRHGRTRLRRDAGAAPEERRASGGRSRAKSATPAPPPDTASVPAATPARRQPSTTLPQLPTRRPARCPRPLRARRARSRPRCGQHGCGPPPRHRRRAETSTRSPERRRIR